MKKKILVYSLIITGLILYCIPIIWYTIPGTDGGVFMYIGKRMLEGAVPYRDIFDHKGPLLYFINALGIFISGGEIWGVRILEIIFIVLAVFISFYSLKKYFGVKIAIFSTAVWLISLPVILAPGNYCEEYAVLFQFVGIWFFIAYFQTNKNKYLFYFGLSLGGVILLRPNLIGVHGAILIYWIYELVTSRRLKQFLIQALIVSGGMFSVILLFLLYFYHHNALYDLWDQLYVFNRAYSTGAWELRLKNFYYLIEYNMLYGLPIISAAGVISGFIFFIKTKSQDLKSAAFIAIVSFFLSLVMILLSLRSDHNYYLSLIPPYALLSGLFFQQVSILLKRKELCYWIAGSMIVFCSIVPARRWAGLVNQNIVKKKHPYIEVVEYICCNSDKKHFVLMWGAETKINLVTGRKSPTKYTYQWPLYRLGYVKESHVERFLSDIRENKPVLIIDTKNRNFASLNDSLRARWLEQYRSPYHQMPESMNRVIDYIKAHYILADTTLCNDWEVYKRIER